mgnify:CR=1 FL=1
MNFTRLGLRRLIATCYGDTAYKAVYAGGVDDDISDCDAAVMHGNGDFRSIECISILKSVDIIVTNPPFSLFREFVTLLMKHNKQFLILGNMNALTYKEIFPYFRDNKMWYGASIHSGDRKFIVPDDYELMASGCGIDSAGHRFIRVKGVRWFTNLDYSTGIEKLVLDMHYNADSYPVYDNYDAINVDKVCDIPCDYSGVMGVPITFMDKYNPDDFIIIGCDEAEGTGFSNGLFLGGYRQCYVGGRRIYKRIFIKRY